jgi:hypothetical protein
MLTRGSLGDPDAERVAQIFGYPLIGKMPLFPQINHHGLQVWAKLDRGIDAFREFPLDDLASLDIPVDPGTVLYGSRLAFDLNDLARRFAYEFKVWVIIKPTGSKIMRFRGRGILIMGMALVAILASWLSFSSLPGNRRFDGLAGRDMAVLGVLDRFGGGKDINDGIQFVGKEFPPRREKGKQMAKGNQELKRFESPIEILGYYLGALFPHMLAAKI